jgi:hypothetical protein
MNFYLVSVAIIVLIAGALWFRVFGRKIRCPFCREWLPRGAGIQVGRAKGRDPYICPFCDHVIHKRDLQSPSA